eukprot:gene10711-7442_t
MATTSHSQPSKAHGNVLFYGLPSIADRRFLETVLQTRIGRALFFGFGVERMAIAELIEAGAAKAIHAALQNGIPEGELGARTADVDTPLCDLFFGGAPEYAYLHFLRFRRSTIRVVWSPLPVDAFYQLGAVVPEHKAPDTRKRPGHDQDAGPAHGVKRVHREVQETEADAAVVLAPPSSKPRAFFPKNCCQKCGSPDHFTRHCDAPAAADLLPTAAAEDIVSKPSPKAQQEQRRAADAPQPSAPVRSSKDQCKHCGSEEHLSRHCPNK